MKKFFIILVVCFPLFVMAKPKQERQTAVFHVEIHCDACVKKIQDNIPFEKGLKDMRIDSKAETVTLTWDPEKTDTTSLKQAFAKIKKPVNRIEMVQPKNSIVQN